ncbi:hypothetical protein CEXT_722091 [Caerostris extrusa]|uniref:Uncharacterized protein n=1 Tax=Caerostris extrusa TaxID=172846 RepID=A0AAV4Y6Z6_CAEEX|nr:hypothetical protein CEXT_722091 [Caerostris extrusa]
MGLSAVKSPDDSTSTFFSSHSFSDAIDAVFKPFNSFLSIQLRSKGVEEENRTQLQCHISPFNEPPPSLEQDHSFCGNSISPRKKGG